MIKRILVLGFLGLLVTQYPVTSQELIAEDSVYFNLDIRASPLAVIDKKGHPNLFFINNGAAYLLKYNQDFKLRTKNNYSKSTYIYSKERGYSVDKNNTIHLFSSTPDYKDFLVLSIKDNGDTYEKEIGLDLKNERVIETFTSNNHFYLLTYTNKSSIINRYKFEDNGFEKISYDLFSKGFCEKINGVCDLKAIFKKNEIQVISDDIPATLGQTANKLKLYPRNDTLHITSDYHPNYTSVISLSLKDNGFDFVQYGNNINDFKRNAKIKSNSFVFKNHIYQILASRRKLKLLIRNFKTREIVKQLSVSKEEEIRFKNSGIYQDNGTFSSNSEKILETKTFLNKIVSGSIGLAVREGSNGLILQFGGVKTISTPAAPVIGIPIASFGSANLFMGAFSSVSNSQAVYTRSLLDPATFEQKNGFAGINIFELIAVYKNEEAKLKNVKRENIFRYNNFYVYGYYDQKSSTYKLLKF